MVEITITGASDDLIEIDGDIQDEWNCFDKPLQHISVSDGTLLSIKYDDDGLWRIQKIVSGTATFAKVEGDVEKDTNDVVTLTGNIKWVALCETNYQIKGR